MPLPNSPDKGSWTHTAAGEPRGYVASPVLKELWFHTGTNCNLRCPFCLEGSMPGSNRLQMPSLADCQPFIAEAVELGVAQFSFTGGEPFVNPDFPAILATALNHAPCLVLTNATEPLLNRWRELPPLLDAPHPLSFRISIDHPDPDRHDAARGRGNFSLALRTLARLHRAGFGVSIARLASPDEDTAAVDAAYQPHLAAHGAPSNFRFVAFPDFLPPGAIADVPEITETCMTNYLTADQRANLMCAFSRMIVKKNDRLSVYACTLVDDDPDYDLGPTLRDSLRPRVMLRHHRCYSCFACGASCSER